MAKKTTQTELALLRQESGYHTKAIAKLETTMKTEVQALAAIVQQHVESSDPFRGQCLENTKDIKWIKRIGKWSFGGGGFIACIITYIKKFGG